jgi:putative phosphoribosyl transferase
MARLTDRTSAGIALGGELLRIITSERPLVIGLTRGGVPVAAQVARILSASLDVLVVRKLGVPSQEELAFGAIAPDSVSYIDQSTIHEFGINPAMVDEIEHRERQELIRRERLYRAGRGPLKVHGRRVILVDDGLATGATMLAACRWARTKGATHITVAVPVGSGSTVQKIQRSGECDSLICLHTPEPFSAVGMWYDDFAPVTDAEVTACLLDSESRLNPRGEEHGNLDIASSGLKASQKPVVIFGAEK